MRTERWRYTEWGGGRQGRELYDHHADPREHHNVIDDPSNQQVVVQLRTLLTRL